MSLKSSTSSTAIPNIPFEPKVWDIKSFHCTFGLSGNNLRRAVTACAVLCFSLFGYDQGLMSGIITAPQFEETFPAVGGGTHHATVVQGAVTSCYELGCFFGALFVLFRGERYGRRRLVISGGIFMTVGALISTFPFKNHWPLGHFVIGRVISGLGNGATTALIPVWQSEMSKPENRGRLVNLEGSVVAVGTFVAYWIDFGLSYCKGSVSWRLPVALQIAFALLAVFGMIGLPESPRWLISKGRMSEARYILGKLDNLPADDDQIVAEATVIADAVNRFENSQIGWKEMISSGKHQYLRRMLLGASSQFFQQFGGCNASIYYSTVLMQTSIGLSRRLSLVLGGVFATVYALSTIPSFFLVDALGRRKLFLLGTIGQGCSFLITFGCLVHETKNNSKGATVGLFLFITFFGMSMLGLPWIYPPEINGLRTRTVATSVSTCTNWICNFAVVMFTPIFINASGWGCYLFFAIMNFIYVPIIFFFYPETAGRSLEEIDIIFAKSYMEGTPAYLVASRMPKLSTQEVEEEGTRLGLFEGDDFKSTAEMKESTLMTRSGSSEADSVPAGDAAV